MAKKRAAGGGGLDYIADVLRPLAVPLGELKVDPRNARRHDAANLAAIRASLSTFGQLHPIVCNQTTGEIVAGNGRYAWSLFFARWARGYGANPETRP